MVLFFVNNSCHICQGTVDQASLMSVHVVAAAEKSSKSVKVKTFKRVNISNYYDIFWFLII